MSKPATVAIALVLCDIPAHRLKAGHLVEADPALIKALTAEGSVDPNKESVAYARSQNATVQRSSIELAAELRAAQADDKRVEIAHLSDLRNKAEGDTAAALDRQILAAQAELADLIAG